jgi:hypothetical protein
MAKYRKKPVVIDAWQFTGNPDPQSPQYLEIYTLEGVMRANPGDWIITGIVGEQYPCKQYIFEQTYELVEGTA